MAWEGSDHPKEEEQDQGKDKGDQHRAGTAEPVREKEEHGTPVVIPTCKFFPPATSHE